MNFEELLTTLTGLHIPPDADQRIVEWCFGAEDLGLARELGGGFEIFIRGPRLQTSGLVARHLRHDRWKSEREPAFEANRLVLPADPHFLPVAAFIAEELIRSGIAYSPQRAFLRSEPIIEMALRRIALNEDRILGMLGELIFLEHLLEAAVTTERRASALEAWKGYEGSARDFVFEGATAVEVKVTRSTGSSHEISSIGQVDPRRSAHGVPLEQLYLLSVGIIPTHDSPSTNPNTVSLPTQVEIILGHLGKAVEPGERNEIQELFLANLRKYGTGSRGKGYDHDEMKCWPAYQLRWILRFERAYNMNDSEIQVLRLEDIERRPFVAPESVRFRIELPDTITNSQNPVTNVRALASSILLERDVTP